MVDLAQVVESTHAELAAKTAELDALRERSRVVHSEVMRLGEELRVLTAVAERHKAFGPQPEPEPEPAHDATSADDGGAPAENEWTKLFRTDAVVRVMHESDRPLGPTEIAKILHGHGRSGDSGQLVSAAIAHLKTQGKVEQAERGKWRLAQPQTPGAAVVALAAPAPQVSLPGGSPGAMAIERWTFGEVSG